MRHLTAADYHVMPWKNGLGATTQMAIEPPDAHFPDTPFLWRLSSAPVDADGPFSVFAGYDRPVAARSNCANQGNACRALPGCWSINAANDMGTCTACTNTPNSNDMAGLGKDCQGKVTNYGTSCVGTKYRIDSANQTCVRSQGEFAWILGVVCCAN